MIATARSQEPQVPQGSAQVESVLIPRGMVGFHNLKDYTLAPIVEAPPFMLLSSVQEPDFAFILVRAEEVDPGYAPKPAPWVQDALALEPADKPVLLLVVNLDGEGGGSVNLRGPVLINPRNGRGAQMALDETFPLRQALRQ